MKLLDATGHKLDRTLLGLRSDNYWILDAMVVDPARMRNRVGMDLWNDMATPPYYAASGRSVRTGVRGRLVEVFVNGAYQESTTFASGRTASSCSSPRVRKAR